MRYAQASMCVFSFPENFGNASGGKPPFPTCEFLSLEWYPHDPFQFFRTPVLINIHFQDVLLPRGRLTSSDRNYRN